MAYFFFLSAICSFWLLFLCVDLWPKIDSNETKSKHTTRTARNFEYCYFCYGFSVFTDVKSYENQIVLIGFVIKFDRRKHFFGLKLLKFIEFFWKHVGRSNYFLWSGIHFINATHNNNNKKNTNPIIFLIKRRCLFSMMAFVFSWW